MYLVLLSYSRRRSQWQTIFRSSTKARGQKNKESFELDMESESNPSKDLDDGHRTVVLIRFHRPTFVCLGRRRRATRSTNERINSTLDRHLILHAMYF